MDFLRRVFAPPTPEYEPVEADGDDTAAEQYGLLAEQDGSQLKQPPRLSKFEYAVFFLLGISMLWAWCVGLALCPLSLPTLLSFWN